jgi:hypothetical protein
VKRARKYFWLGLLLAIPIVVRPQGGIVTGHVALTDRGHVEDLTYSNATLGFTYQLPQAFFVNPLPDSLPHGSLLLMIADTHNGTPWRDRITLVADDTEKIFVEHLGIRHSLYRLTAQDARCRAAQCIPF